MSSGSPLGNERWQTLSSWHNAWLTADAAERVRLRGQLAEDHPELVDEAERLIADASSLEGFLETPAFVLAASELAAAHADGLEIEPPDDGSSSPQPWWMAGALVLAVIAGGIGWQLGLISGTARPDAPLARFTVALPAGVDLRSAPALSPDGQRVAFAGGTPAGSRLMVRDLATEDTTIIDGTEDAASPFWSPDGEWVGFSAHGRLMKVARAGGAPVVIDGAVGSWGGAWASSRVMVFQSAVRNAGLLRVSDSGGRSEPASILDDAAGDISHRFPVMLPDGRTFLYHVDSTDSGRRGTYVGRLGTQPTAATRRLGTLDSQATYVALPGESGLLLWATGRSIELRPFDVARRRVGAPQVVNIAAAPATQSSPAMLSATAEVLAYATAGVMPGPTREIGIVIGWRRLAHDPN